MNKFKMVRLLSKKKPIYVYDVATGMLIRTSSSNHNVQKRASGSILCCASPIIITKTVEINSKHTTHIDNVNT